jgi:hypothetical protein
MLHSLLLELINLNPTPPAQLLVNTADTFLYLSFLFRYTIIKGRVHKKLGKLKNEKNSLFYSYEQIAPLTYVNFLHTSL